MIEIIFDLESETTLKQDQDFLISIVKSDPDFSFKNANFQLDRLDPGLRVDPCFKNPLKVCPA